VGGEREKGKEKKKERERKKKERDIKKRRTINADGAPSRHARCAERNCRSHLFLHVSGV
jgi:hypothetical protein